MVFFSFIHPFSPPLLSPGGKKKGASLPQKSEEKKSTTRKGASRTEVGNKEGSFLARFLAGTVRKRRRVSPGTLLLDQKKKKGLKWVPFWC